MAKMDEGMNRGSTEPSGRKKNGTDASRRRIPGVDFEEMNFEQRRPPYNSGNRKEDNNANDRSPENDNPGRNRDER